MAILICKRNNLNSLYMKNALLIALLLLFASAVFGQDYIQFTYVDGNRKKRELKTVKITNPTQVQTHLDTTVVDDKVAPKPVEDVMGEEKISIYPNPTKGNLSVEITSNTPDVVSEITVFTLTGQQIFRSNSSDTRVEVDITSKPSGTYIMRVSRGGNVSTWKIIKE